MPLGSEPVPAQSERTLLEANRVLVVTSDSNGALPPTVTLGADPSRDRALLIAFPNLWAAREVDAAFLLLEPASEAEPGSADVVIHVALAAAAWVAGAAPEAPSERSPKSTGLGRTRPPSLLRIDVTAQVRALQERPEADHGFMLRAENQTAHGATYLTGALGGTPRLDVYSRPRRGVEAMSAPASH